MSAVSPKAALIQSFRSRRIVNGTGFEPLVLPVNRGRCWCALQSPLRDLRYLAYRDTRGSRLEHKF